MNITCTWSISNMQHLVDNGGVIAVEWSCTAKGGDKSAKGGDKSAYHGGKSEFTPDPAAPDFVPYDQLTEEMVLGWVFAALGDEKAAIEADRIAKVEKQLNSTVASGVPWSEPEPEPEPEPELPV